MRANRVKKGTLLAKERSRAAPSRRAWLRERGLESGAARAGRGYKSGDLEQERQRRLRELRAKRDALERKDCSPAALALNRDDESVAV